MSMSKELRDRLLLQAARHIRSRGYAAFSYADLSRENGVSKATVHHYFRTKEELGAALLADHQDRFAAHLAGILERSPTSSERLRAYGDLFREGFSDGMLPLCGALAAERDALPESLRAGARGLFEAQLRWLEAVLDQGSARGELSFKTSSQRVAVMLLAALEGGAFIGWGMSQPEAGLTAYDDAVAGLTAARFINDKGGRHDQMGGVPD